MKFHRILVPIALVLIAGEVWFALYIINLIKAVR